MLRGIFFKVGENQRQKHKICKTKVQVEFYFNIVWNHEYEMKWTRLWYKIILQIGVEHTKNNGGVFYNYIFLGN
jgi:hypothetical protein